MRKPGFFSTRLARGVAILLSVAIAGSGAGATVALASAHHKHHHKHHHHKGHHHKHAKKASYKQVCHKRSHGKRVKTRCTTATTKKPNAHGNGVSAATNQSNNWSGYNQGTLEQGGKLFNSVSAEWTVPTVKQHTSGQAEYSSDWIGIGGGCVDAGCTVTDPTLIQTGTEQDVSSSGSPSYSVWWEIIPGPSLTITSMSVNPGDRMSAKIAELVADSDVWTISINDLTNGQSYSVTVPYSSTHDSAEWIQETPLLLSTNAGFAAQPDLTSPAFDLATTNGSPAGLKSSEEIQLIDSNGNPIGTPSSPDSDSDGFNVCAWATTCAAPSSS